jgi:hypothetical protein
MGEGYPGGQHQARIKGAPQHSIIPSQRLRAMTGFGSWLCENADVRKTDYDCEFRREDSNACSFRVRGVFTQQGLLAAITVLQH